MDTTLTEPQSAGSWAGTKDGWRQRGLHRVTLPSTQRVLLRIPDLAKLLEGPDAAVPTHLLSIALREVIDQADAARTLVDQIKAGQTDEAVKTVGELNELDRWIVTQTVVEPEVTLEDVEAGLVPPEDMAMIAAIARRERFTDARGVTIGVVPLDDFAVFREKHGCPEGVGETGCQACQEVQAAFSSVDVGAV
jgi:hypothetical protein